MRKVILSFVCAMALFSACEKVVLRDPSTDPIGTTQDTTPPTVTTTDPTNSATAVSLNHPIAITFSEAMDPSTITTSTVTILQGTTPVTGTISYSGTQALFTPNSNLTPNKIYTGTVTTGVKDVAGNVMAGNYTFTFTSGAAPDVTPPVVSSSDPVNNATGVSFSKIVAVNFSEALDPTTVNNTTFTVKQGTANVSGTVAFTGTQATFVANSSLSANTVYTGTITTGVKDLAGNALASNYTFSFTTGSAPDITPPVVNSSDPVSNATGVAVTKVIAVTFSKALNATTVTSTTFTVKQGTSSVAGTVTYAGSTASFTPIGSLAYSSTYTVTITTGIKDLAGNALASNYSYSFTTGAAPDVTKPTIVTTDPVSNATAVATSKVIGITFSEAMTSSSITSSTFTLKQGTTAVTGTVAYSGTTATFTPSAALTAGTVYTASISTGAKDLAGNTLAAATTWSFTTAGTAPAPALSFATDVVPVLVLCENCHSHGWTASTNASTYYTNLVNKGYVKPASYTTSTIYTKLGTGHPGAGSISTANTDKIINWMKQGSLNN